MTQRWPRALAIGLGLLALAPAAVAAQTPALPQTAPPATSRPVPERPDPSKVVAVSVSEPLDLLQTAGDEIKLSDERLVTRWAHAQSAAKIRLSPQTSSRSITRLRFLTEDGLPEVYPVLGARMDSAGRRWLHVRIPRRPNGKTGWVIDETLGQLYIVKTTLVVDRRKLRATLFKSGRKIWSARVGIGKDGTPTPRGQFWIRERLKGIGGSSVYGPWAFGTSAYSNLSDWPGGGVVGIHGTNEPGLIPGRPSHGCIRVKNNQIRRLAKLMPIGTPVSIIN